jgi:hypothetical protein
MDGPSEIRAKMKGQGNYRTIFTPRHPRNTVQQSRLNQHKVRGDQMSDLNTNPIPTIVNGELNFSKQSSVSESTINKRDYLRNLVNVSTVKLLENKAKYLEDRKHKVLMIGDSHVRGCAASMVASLDERFEVCGVVKPGSLTESISGIMKEEANNK